MNYKKKYEEALEYMRTIYPTLKEADKEDIEHYFPELKENEDEKIRNFITNELACLRAIDEKGSDRYKELTNAINWLEKQGEQETLCYKCRKEQPSHSCQDITALGRCAVEHEQKPIDKSEPKFKVGDWIVNSEGKIRHIVHVDNTGYQTDNGWLSHEFYEKTYHLWTIQDAKDGDILAHGSCICIFITKDVENESFVAKLYLFNNKFYCSNKLYFDTRTIKPATKEQRDLFFQKMKEAGYEWDVKKKELKKIEHKPVKWSEEDEHRVKDTIYFLDTAKKHYASVIELDACIDWLKSLKQRMKGQ